MAGKSARKVGIWIGIAVLLVIVVCTFLSRTIEAALMPQVEVAHAEQGTVPQELRTTGTVSLGDSAAFFLAGGGERQEVAGQQCPTGDGG